MKILYLVTKSEAGGAQTHIYQLSKYFIEKGNKVAVMSYPGGWLETQINADIKQKSAEEGVEKLLYSEITYKIRGAIFSVWKTLGSAFKETIYQKALEDEFKKVGLNFESQKQIDIVYNNKKIGVYRPDFVIENKILIELKALPYLSNLEEKQLWYYLKGSNYRLALLVNFGGEKLEIKRWIYDKIRDKQFQRNSAWYQRNSAHIKFYPNKYFSNIPDPIRIFKAMKEIRKVVKDFKPDLVGCHSTAAGFLGRMAVRNKIPTTFTAHGWAFTEGAPFLRKCLAILIEKIAGKFCSKIICVSDSDRNLALKYKIVSKEKVITIHNGVEISINQPNQRKSAFIKIVFVGRLAQPKDPLLLLKSFNSLASELKDKSQVSIIGEGPKRKELEKFIKENKLGEKIRLLGSISREEVFEILRNSNIFVLISNWEGFPYTIIEAMSCGLAIIASEVGGVKEAVNESCGILIKRGDKEGIKNALGRLLKNPSLIKEMGERGKEKVKEEFSLDKMLEKTEKIYKSV